MLDFNETIIFVPNIEEWKMSGKFVLIPTEYNKNMNITALERFFEKDGVRFVLKDKEWIARHHERFPNYDWLVVRIDDYETLYTKFDLVRDTIKEMLCTN